MYDFNNMNLVKLWLSRTHGPFFDVGANIGSYTLVASEASRARVFAFEPSPFTFSNLELNIEHNQRRNVTAIRSAVGEYDGVVSFSNVPADATNRRSTDRDAIEVPMLRLNTFIAEHGIVPDVLKIDVEGFEYEVLSGCGEYLRDIAMLLIEMKGHSDRRSVGEDSILELIRASGFDGPFAFHFRSRRLTEQSGESEDSVFLSPRGRATMKGLAASLSRERSHSSPWS